MSILGDFEGSSEAQTTKTAQATLLGCAKCPWVLVHAPYLTFTSGRTKAACHWVSKASWGTPHLVCKSDMQMLACRWIRGHSVAWPLILAPVIMPWVCEPAYRVSQLHWSGTQEELGPFQHLLCPVQALGTYTEVTKIGINSDLTG